MLRKTLSLAALAALAALPVRAADLPTACTAPGELVSEDASGDDLLAPTGEGFGDIQSLHIGQPNGGDLVFTYKMADLATLPPNHLWIVRFVMDVLPSDGIEYFVAMVTDPSGAPLFLHGTAAEVPEVGSTLPTLIFTPKGTLEGAMSADGTITLTLPRSAYPDAMYDGAGIFQMVPLTHRITPTDGTVPFVYFLRGTAAANINYDESADGFYEIVSPAACGGKAATKAGGSTAVAGAPGPAALLMLALGALARRRR